MMTSHTSAIIHVADLAALQVSSGWNGPKTLGWFQRLGTGKLDLGHPHGAGHMDPIVARRTLQWLSRVWKFRQQTLGWLSRKAT